ncbi:MAG TPA: carboxypeptidase-like regulatory domain-containing protein [Clostridia bacterium]|nr:carboxypeptidase-like regulatory domain-containing protein [Clostridia bacterium]
MKKTLAVSVLLLAAVAMATGQIGGARDSVEVAQQRMRSLVGQVTDKGDRPLPSAIVYLKNTKTLTVKTFIADSEGGYRFHALSPNVDYEVHAEVNGKASDSKTLSAFDSRAEARINLKVDVR